VKITSRHVYYSLFMQYFSVFLTLRNKIPVKNGKEPDLNPAALKRVFCRVSGRVIGPSITQLCMSTRWYVLDYQKTTCFGH